MGNFQDRNSRPRSGGFRNNSEPREMHDAVCSKCKKECQVPFKPTQGKPVLCKECFSKENPRDGPRSGGFNRNNNSNGRGFNRNNSRDAPRDMHKAVCDECKKNCEVPFKPTPGKPVLCKECFSKKNPRY
jgi:CxxC-x17-CxxC domain-containing protein